MELLDKIYLGNTLHAWLTALIILVIAFAVLKIILVVAIRRMKKFAAATTTKIDDLVVGILNKTKFLILLVASAYIASQAIVMKPSLEIIWRKAVILILLVQAGIWGCEAINIWLKLTLQKRMDQDASSTTTLSFLGFVARFVLWIIILLLVLDNMGVNITGLVAGLGIGGVAVALAVQNILGDLLASLSIVLDKPFVIGDFIVVDSLSGTIEHIGLKTTRIRSLSGEQLVFSNGDLLKTRIHNYKRMSERRVVFSFGVIYQTTLEKLKGIKGTVSDIIRNTKEYGDSSLNFEVVYYVTSPDYNLYMDVQEKINLEIFRRFSEEGIEFAYPTRTVFIENG